MHVNQTYIEAAQTEHSGRTGLARLDGEHPVPRDEGTVRLSAKAESDRIARRSSVQICPPQPKILLFQSLPQSLQPSECVWPQGRFEKIACRLSFSASCSGIT